MRRVSPLSNVNKASSARESVSTFSSFIICVTRSKTSSGGKGPIQNLVHRDCIARIFFLTKLEMMQNLVLAACFSTALLSAICAADAMASAS